MPATAEPRTDRLSARCRPVDGARVRAAAEKSRLPFSAFMIQALLERSEAVLGKETYENMEVPQENAHG